MVEKQRESKGKKMNLHVLSFTVAYFKHSMFPYSMQEMKKCEQTQIKEFSFFFIC